MKTVSRRLALWRADLEAGVCAVPEEAAAALGEGDKVIVVLDNRQTFECELRQDVEWQLTGLTWPGNFPPGVLVTVSWHPGRGDFVIRPTPLDDPLRVDGVDYFYAYDPKVATRDYAPDKSNRAKVLHTVRKSGRVFDDGSTVLSEELLTKRSGLGRGAKAAFLLRNAVDQLIREGFLTRVTGSVDSAGHPSYPAVDGQAEAEMVFYAPMVEPIPEESHRGDHWVSGFIRKLPRGAQPSAKRQEAARSAGIGPLAPGYTFVKKHHRNG